MAIDLFRALPQGTLRGMRYGSAPKFDMSRYNGSDESIIFGRGVFGYKGEETRCMPPLGDTITVTLSKAMVDGDELTLTVRDEDFVQAFDTSVAVTAEKMLAKLNADSSILATYDTLVYTITTLYNKVDVSGVVTGTSAPTVALGSASVSASQVFLGVAVRNANDGLLREDGDKDVYPSGRAVTVRNMGSIVVEVADLDAIDVATNVYVALEESRGGVFVASDDSGSKRSVGQSFYMEKPPEQDSGDNLAVVTLIGGVY